MNGHHKFKEFVLIVDSWLFYLIVLGFGFLAIYLMDIGIFKWTKLNYIAASLYNVKGFAHMRSYVKRIWVIWTSFQAWARIQFPEIKRNFRWIRGQVVTHAFRDNLSAQLGQKIKKKKKAASNKLQAAWQ